MPMTNDPIQTFANASIHTPLLTLSGLSSWGRVVDVLDGDTLHIVLPFIGQQFRCVVRLAGVDTCEMKSKNVQVKFMALKARLRLLELVSGQSINESMLYITRKEIQDFLKDTPSIVFVRCLEMDKYGRVLAEIYSKDGSESQSPSFSQTLINEGLAYSYNGQAKPSEEEQLELLKATKTKV